jgi:hypothetical protein
MDENELTHDTFSVKDKVEYLYYAKNYTPKSNTGTSGNGRGE